MTTFILGSVSLVTPIQFLPKSILKEYVDEAADGSLKCDIVGSKMQFTLGWEYLEDTHFEAMQALYESGQNYSFTYPVSGGSDTKTVHITACEPRELIYVDLYKDVTMILKEV